jgi:DNA-binding response OmpR family regulator
MQIRPIVMIDDDESTRELVTEYLSLEGYQAVGVADPVAALRDLPTYRPSLILLDSILGSDTTDADFIAAYHSTPGPHAPIVLFTGRADPEARAEELRIAGALPKPFDLQDLLAVVRQHAAT